MYVTASSTVASGSGTMISFAIPLPMLSTANVIVSIIAQRLTFHRPRPAAKNPNPKRRSTSSIQGGSGWSLPTIIMGRPATKPWSPVTMNRNANSETPTELPRVIACLLEWWAVEDLNL